MLLYKLLLLVVFIFIIVQAIRFGINITKKIDEECDIKQREEEIKDAELTAKQVTKFKEKNAVIIERETKNKKVITDFIES